MVVKAGNHKPFGIGCFSFRYTDKPPFALKPATYLAELKKTLQSLTNVTNLTITEAPPIMFQNISVEKDDSLPSIRERGGPFPGFLAEQLQFDLFIPVRYQQERVRVIPEHRTHKSEKYRVTVLDAFYIAVTFVEPLEPEPGEVGADSVIVVREFLANELAAMKNTAIKFECLGPSPLHANCVLLGSPNTLHDEVNDPAFDCAVIPGPYEELRFRYNTAAFDGIEEAKNALFHTISEELAVYYYIVQNESAKITDWSKIDDRVQKIIRLHRRKGPLGWFARSWSASRAIDETFVAIAEFEAKNLAMTNRIRTAQRIHYDGTNSTFFRRFVENAVADQQSYPVQQMTHLITMFESRRLKSTEIVAVIFGAVLGFLGGVAGAVLTSILTK